MRSVSAPSSFLHPAFGAARRWESGCGFGAPWGGSPARGHAALREAAARPSPPCGCCVRPCPLTEGVTSIVSAHKYRCPPAHLYNLQKAVAGTPRRGGIALSRGAARGSDGASRMFVSLCGAAAALCPAPCPRPAPCPAPRAARIRPGAAMRTAAAVGAPAGAARCLAIPAAFLSLGMGARSGLFSSPSAAAGSSRSRAQLSPILCPEATRPLRAMKAERGARRAGSSPERCGAGMAATAAALRTRGRFLRL